jgi:hypothetical protein
VLYTDDAGVSRWILPEESSLDAAAVTRGGEGGIVFHLPRNGAPDPPGEGAATVRGPIAKLGRRVVRMLSWVTDDIVGKGAWAVAKEWENSKRPYGLHRVQPGAIGGDMDWDALSKGRAFLLLHGTFDTAQKPFGEFVKSKSFEILFALYEGRVFAFDHPTLHHTPIENVHTFLEMTKGRSLDLDILTHSRGGIVGRELVQHLAGLDSDSCTIRVHRAILTACPNRGTILADGDNWIDLVDRYTNLLTHLPDNVYTLTMEGILVALKLLAHGALAGLPGLNCMRPGGSYLQQLNRGAARDVQYHALSADFTPSDSNLLALFSKRVEDEFLDRIFQEANDSMVPTEGCYTAGPHSPGFPIPEGRRAVYEPGVGIHHGNFFTKEAVNEQILAWLVA